MTSCRATSSFIPDFLIGYLDPKAPERLEYHRSKAMTLLRCFHRELGPNVSGHQDLQRYLWFSLLWPFVDASRR